MLLPIALGIIMFGLGLSLTVANFKRVIAFPKAVAVGLAPELAVGFMLLAASPGGATANLFSQTASCRSSRCRTRSGAHSRRASANR